MTKVMTRAELAQLMTNEATKLPTGIIDGVNYDAKFNALLKASEVLSIVGQPFATLPVRDEKSPDGFKTIQLRRYKDIPKEIKITVIEAMKVFNVETIRG